MYLKGLKLEVTLHSLHSDCKNLQKSALTNVNIQRTGKTSLQMFVYFIFDGSVSAITHCMVQEKAYSCRSIGFFLASTCLGANPCISPAACSTATLPWCWWCRGSIRRGPGCSSWPTARQCRWWPPSPPPCGFRRRARSALTARSSAASAPCRYPNSGITTSRIVSAPWPSGRKGISSAGIMMPPRTPPSSTPSWAAANLPTWMYANGWAIFSATSTAMTPITHATCRNSSPTISKRRGFSKRLW